MNTMKQTEEIKAMIREMMNQEMENYKEAVSNGEAVGGDGRKYKFENPENIFPIGSSICVRATCIETGRGDVYGLDFFV